MRTRFIPNGFTAEYETESLVIYSDRKSMKAIAYKGKSNKPLWHYRFLKMSDMDCRINSTIESVLKEVESKRIKAEKLAELKADFDIRKFLKVGDILQNTWGWEQTNNDFYQIIEIKGKGKLVCRELCQDYRETGFMSGQTKPIKDSFLKDETEILNLTCKAEVSEQGFKICNPESYYYFHVWNGKESYSSHYA